MLTAKKSPDLLQEPGVNSEYNSVLLTNNQQSNIPLSSDKIILLYDTSYSQPMLALALYVLAKLHAISSWSCCNKTQQAKILSKIDDLIINRTILHL